MVNGNRNPIIWSRTKSENPLAPTHTKSKGVFFLSSASSLGRGSFYDDKDFDKKPEISANLRLYVLSPHAAGCSCFWYLRRAYEAYTGNERKGKAKREPCFVATQKQGCAHDCSAYIARA